MKTAASSWSTTASVDLRDYFSKDGPKQPQGTRRRVNPKSVNQRRYLDAIEQHDIVFGVGPAGTGKTYLAMAQAVSYLLAKKVSRIILARPAVEAGEKLGFLPGDLQEKVNPYLRPLYDALYDMMDTEKATRLVERGTIEVAPLAFMRGRTLNDAFVILDEAQNTTSEQMKMFLTRLGFGSKAVVTGDITQIDLPNPQHVRPGRGAEDRQRHRGHRHRLLRRQGRRPAQAGAADRQGLRRLLERPRVQGRVERGRRRGSRSCRSTSVPSAARPCARPGWRAGSQSVAPARARGAVTVALVPDARVRALNRRYRGRMRRPTSCRFQPRSRASWAMS